MPGGGTWQEGNAVRPFFSPARRQTECQSPLRGGRQQLQRVAGGGRGWRSWLCRRLWCTQGAGAPNPPFSVGLLISPLGFALELPFSLP